MAETEVSSQKSAIDSVDQCLNWTSFTSIVFVVIGISLKSGWKLNMRILKYRYKIEYADFFSAVLSLLKQYSTKYRQVSFFSSLKYRLITTQYSTSSNHLIIQSYLEVNVQTTIQGYLENLSIVSIVCELRKRLR